MGIAEKADMDVDMGNKRRADGETDYLPLPLLKIGEEEGWDGCPPVLEPFSVLTIIRCSFIDI
jgi:hypothetical protein